MIKQKKIKKDDNKNILLGNRNFFLLAQGIFITKLGSAGFFIAIALTLKDISNSGSIMALIVGISAIPTILFSTLGGLVADKYYQPKIMVAVDIISGLASCVLALFFLFETTPFLKMFMIFIIATIHTFDQAFYDPAYKTLLPLLVRKEQLLKGNSSIVIANHSSNILGQTLAGFVYELVGPIYLFFIDGISYFLSALSACFIKVEKKTPASASTAKHSEKPTGWIVNYFINFMTTWNLSKDVEGIRGLFLLEIVVNFISAPTIIYLTFLTQDHLGLDHSWYSWFLAFLTIGGITGAILARSLKNLPRFYVVMFALIIISFSKLLIAQFRIAFLSMFLLFIEANLYTIIAILNMTTIQEKVHNSLLGRIFGLKDMFNRASVPLGLIAGGILVDVFHKNMLFVFSINGAALLTVSIIFLFYAKLKSFFTIKHSVLPSTLSLSDFENGSSTNLKM